MIASANLVLTQMQLATKVSVDPMCVSMFTSGVNVALKGLENLTLADIDGHLPDAAYESPLIPLLNGYKDAVKTADRGIIEAAIVAVSSALTCYISTLTVLHSGDVMDEGGGVGAGAEEGAGAVSSAVNSGRAREGSEIESKKVRRKAAAARRAIKKSQGIVCLIQNYGRDACQQLARELRAKAAGLVPPQTVQQSEVKREWDLVKSNEALVKGLLERSRVYKDAKAASAASTVDTAGSGKAAPVAAGAAPVAAGATSTGGRRKRSER